MFEPFGEPSKQPRFEPPISIIEIVLVALVLYVAYQVFMKEDQRGSRFNGDTEVAASVVR